MHRPQRENQIPSLSETIGWRLQGAFKLGKCRFDLQLKWVGAVVTRRHRDASASGDAGKRPVNLRNIKASSDDVGRKIQAVKPLWAVGAKCTAPTTRRGLKVFRHRAIATDATERQLRRAIVRRVIVLHLNVELDRCRARRNSDGEDGSCWWDLDGHGGFRLNYRTRRARMVP